MKRLAYISALLLPAALMAQDSQDASQTERDRGFIVALLEDQLSGAGRDIRIEGFKGLLSKNARLGSLTIADETGVWFTLEEAALAWDRAALLDGQLNVTSLTARTITWARLPDSPTDPSLSEAPGATRFTLPDLPIGIDIQKIEAETVTLGSAVLGFEEDLTLKVSGGGQLAEGGFRAGLEIDRLDGPDGSFRLESAYSAETDSLSINLDVSEAQNGIIAELSGIPGAPELDLTAKGAGPLDDLTVALSLTTNGTPRLSGDVALQGLVQTPAAPQTEAGTTVNEVDAAPATSRKFSADISGDLRPLFTADLHPFFGPDARLVTSGQTRPQGGFALSNAIIATQGATLAGAAVIGANGLPEMFRLKGWVGRPDGQPLALPSTNNSLVERVDIAANFDAKSGDQWSAAIEAQGYESDFGRVETAVLSGFGTIDAGFSSAVSGLLSGTVSGITPRDEALAPILDGEIALTGDLSWTAQAPLRINGLQLTSPSADIFGAGQIFGLDDGFKIAGQTTLDMSQLSDFSALAGRALSGTLSGKLGGSFTPLGGAFDLTLNAQTEALDLGLGNLSALTGGRNRLFVDALRDEGGITLKEATLDGRAVTARAAGRLSETSSALSLSASLDDLARLIPEFSGPAQLTAELSRPDTTAPWRSSASVSGPGGAAAQLTGALSGDFASADLSVAGSAPLGLSNLFTSAALTQGLANFDLLLRGPLSLSSLSGQISASQASTVLSNLGLRFDLPELSGSIAGGALTLAATAQPDTGGRIGIGGTISLDTTLNTALRVDIQDMGLEQPNLFRSTMNGQLELNGPLSGTPLLSGTIEIGETNVTVSPTSLGSTGDLLDITHVGDSAAIRQTRSQAGLDRSSVEAAKSAGVALDVTVNAPNKIFLRGRGLDAEMGGSLRLGGTSADLQPVGEFSLLRGRLSLLGQRIDMESGQITLLGNLNPQLRLNAATNTDDLSINIALSGDLDAPELSLSSAPELPDEEILARLLFGRELANISAFQAAQLASAVATLTGQGGGVVGSIRDAFNLDDLDLQTSDEGTSAVRLGRYITDELYTDVTIDSEGKSEINLNLDATDNITIRGSAATNGETGLGVFFEKDY